MKALAAEAALFLHIEMTKQHRQMMGILVLAASPLAFCGRLLQGDPNESMVCAAAVPPRA